MITKLLAILLASTSLAGADATLSDGGMIRTESKDAFQTPASVLYDAASPKISK